MKNQQRRRYYPTLLERIRAARWTLQLQHSPIMQSVATVNHHKDDATTSASPASPIPTCFLIEPSIAKSILATHGLRYFDDGEDSASGCCSSGSSDVDEQVDDDDTESKFYYADLHKPTKPTVLLHHALTNSNGNTWKRQRYCVSRAFAINKATRGLYAIYAVNSAMEVIGTLVFNENDNSRRILNPIRIWAQRHRRNNIIDIRYFAKEVAIQTLCRIVFGTPKQQQHKQSNDNTIIINNLLRDMVLDTLELRRDEEYCNMSASIVDQLDAAVRDEIEDIISRTMNDDVEVDASCLVERLLQYSNSDDEYYLTKDEIVGNVHSALLAGIQTISTTLAGSILHLAERPELQNELRTNGILDENSSSVSGKDVVNETLRILPPVAGLPRIPKNRGVEVYSSALSSSCPVRIKKDQLVIIDLLAFSHAQKEVSMSTDKNDSDGKHYQSMSLVCSDTLQFNPMKTRKRQGETAAPWGIGRRSCPAGIISVECISAILEGIAKCGVTYSIEKDKDRCVIEKKKKKKKKKKKNSNQHNMGWFQAIRYRPTLSYSKPLFIRFNKHR